MSESKKKPGTVYLVGAGPGDPGLITVRGLRLIREADVVVHDYLAAPDFLKETKAGAELIYVGKKGGDHIAEQPKINEILVTKACEGKTVVRLKGGDPYLFGRGAEEAEELNLAGVRFETVPGVTSAIAAPAYAGIPVTHRDHASMVTFVTGHEDPSKSESAVNWDLLAKGSGTLVFLMGVGNLGAICSNLIDKGRAPETPAALVRWGTTPKQVSVFATLNTLPEEATARGVKAPAVLVVGTVARLRDSLAWYERKPLFGKRILITRGREQSRRMADMIREAGGAPILCPVIEIVPPADFGPLDRAIARISDFDWVIFTSVNGVEGFFSRFFELRGDIREMAGPRLGAIGPVTARALKDRGLKVETPATEFTAEGVLAALPQEEISGRKFLIPRAEEAREILPRGIAAQGGLVEVAPVYRTRPPREANVEEIRKLLRRGEVDAITFTSSSTVTNFLDMLGPADGAELLEGVVVGSIGPVTSSTARRLGVSVNVEATKYTVEGLISALEDYFTRARRSC
jgi:uroporphyrinogen III methyltransferase/synthase